MRLPIVSPRWSCVVIGIVAALATQQTYADPPPFLVGGDSCHFSDIQSAIDAAASHPGPDIIHVAINGTYTAQALRIGAQDLSLIGGFANCATPTPSIGLRTTISGAGGVANSVLVITGRGDRNLQNLLITGGDDTDSSKGGGIDFEGGGVLALSNVSVQQNKAGYGGGISFNGSGSVGAILSLGIDTLIQNNIASNSGGGIRIEGDARLFMLNPRSAIVGNEARGLADESGYGGGLQIRPPARAEIGSSGLGDLGAISHNKAKYGGGIAIPGRDDLDITTIGSALLYTTDPQRPVRVDNNVASIAGGGVYISTEIFYSTNALCAYEFRIDHNRAPDGAALFLDEDLESFDPWTTAIEGGSAFFNVANQLTEYACAVSALPPSPIALNCAPGVLCNSIDHNIVAQSNGQPADGAIMELKHASYLVANRVRWSHNQGSDVVHGLPGFIGAQILTNCLFDSNALTARLIATAAPFSMHNCTIADNIIGFTDVMSLTDNASIEDSIIWQPGHASVGANHGALDAAFILSNDPASFPASTVINLDPRFVDPTHSDFRLRASSPAIDVAPAVVAAGDQDLDFSLRDVDVKHASAFGPRDLGAYERLSLQPLVLNPDFLSDLALWNEVVPGVSTFDPRENHDAISRGGALFVNYQRSDVILPRVTARSQCIHLPLPGRYSLSGSARTSGSLPPTSVQNAVLHWEFRTDGGEACNEGRPSLQGDMPITSGLNWAQKVMPILALSGAQWTRNSSITISTVMTNGGTAARDNLRGWFDHIELLLDGYP